MTSLNRRWDADKLVAPDWLNNGDNAWQLTAATLVGLQSVPGLMVMYAGSVVYLSCLRDTDRFEDW